MTEKKRHRVYPPLLTQARLNRNSPTPAEAALWQELRGGKHGLKFRRQHPIDRFIVDFYCPKARLCIEIDGLVHDHPEQKEYDTARTEYLQEHGYHVLRFSNEHVLNHTHSVVEQILSAARDRIKLMKYTY